MLSREGDAETLLVRGTGYEKLEVPVELVEGLDAEADCLWVSELEA